MKTVFADTLYYIALANPRDEWHQAAKAIGPKLGAVRFITIDEVLVELLAFYSENKCGRDMRNAAIQLVHKIIHNPNITVLPQTRDSFHRGLRLYESRPDKGYSLTDCISMETMRDRKLSEVLTHDHHFTQEGFVILLIDKTQ